VSGLGQCLELDGRESFEAALPAAPVVGLLDPGDDRQPQVLPVGPALPVEDVALQPGEEGLHRGVVSAGADAAHRADQPVVLDRTQLISATLTDAYLDGATLIDANLYRATLTGANLIDANLTRASLGAATLANARLARATLTDAGLKLATLADADLTEATLTVGALNRAQSTSALGTDRVKWISPI
jgi:hypothetical protein